ncbi:MAG: helicase HerA-like domain-containing protein [Pseudomonadota bacterium]
MTTDNSLLIGGKNQQQVRMPTSMANRHGMIAGATGTGKTVTMQIMAEEFSKAGVPVLMADVKGDVSGLACAASSHPKIDERIEAIGISDYQSLANPVVFWDLYGKLGHPVRATVSELGPLLLSNLMALNETQTGVLYAAFKIADDNGLLLLDLEDLQSLLGWMADNASELRGEYGNFTSASIGAIQRDLLVLEEQDAEVFLGEPVLQLDDLMKMDFSGRGVVNVLDVTTIISRGPRLYATFLLWLMAELFENMPEVGDADKPKFVMFFDEAHLLFDDAPKALVDKIEQVVRLIRSKGVGVYFVSQSPLDIPEDVLGQLGLKIQHALRAFTPKEREAVSVVAENFRENPDIDTEAVITELGVGEALVSVLDEEGIPTPVEQILIRPPQSRIGPASPEERTEQIKRSPIGNKYDDAENRESAMETLKVRAEEQMRKAEEEEARIAAEKEAARQAKEAERAAKAAEKERVRKEREEEREARRKARGSGRQTASEAMMKSIARSVGTQLGRKVVRGILGSLFGGR